MMRSFFAQRCFPDVRMCLKDADRMVNSVDSGQTLLHVQSHLSWHSMLRFEPPHDKTNKMTGHPGKTQISLGICPV